MKARRVAALGSVMVVGGALRWLASVASLKLLETHPGLPLFLGQTLTMPIVAVGVWLAVRHFWPTHARIAALLLALSTWLVPGLWLILSDLGRPGSEPLRLSAVPALLAGGPAILSAYMVNSLGLAAALIALCSLTLWRRGETHIGA